jgi:hypothetical protein
MIQRIILIFDPLQVELNSPPFGKKGKTSSAQELKRVFALKLFCLLNIS